MAAVIWNASEKRTWTAGRAFGIGVVTGALVLIRPIGVCLPPLACLGLLLVGRRFSKRSAAIFALAGFVGSSLVVVPWLARNRIVSGHWSLTHQTGASFAYHKVADVVLWSQGRSRYRFDADTLDEVRTGMDHRLHAHWRDRHGPLTAAQRQTLTWRKLNFGRAEGIDPFEASGLLWRVGLEMLAGRKFALVQCFTAQGGSMLVFPLNLVLHPPAGRGSAPLSTLLGESRAGVIVAVVLGSAYAALAMAVCVKLVLAGLRRRWSPALFVLWPMLAIFALSLPFEDPRFRLPLMPFMWLLAIAPAWSRTAPCAESPGRLK